MRHQRKCRGRSSSSSKRRRGRTGVSPSSGAVSSSSANSSSSGTGVQFASRTMARDNPALEVIATGHRVENKEPRLSVKLESHINSRMRTKTPQIDDDDDHDHHHLLGIPVRRFATDRRTCWRMEGSAIDRPTDRPPPPWGRPTAPARPSRLLRVVARPAGRDRAARPGPPGTTRDRPD